jgi:hypothetical protein
VGKEMQGVWRWLAEKQTENEVANAIVLNLTCCRNGTRAEVYTGHFPGLRDAITRQALLRWGAALEGWWCTGWMEVQQLQFNNSSLRCSRKRWFVALIEKL